MTGFVAEIDNDAAEAAQEAASGGNGTFPPLPAGKYQAFIEKVEGVKPFGGNGGNAKKSVLSLRVKIVAESPTGAGRVYFLRVPLFTRYAPNEKNPKGAPARMFWDFFEKAIGWSRDLLITNQLPGPEDVGGKHLTITLGVPQAPDQYNPHGFNEIAFVDAAGDVNATPTNKVMVPWLDDNGNLTGEWANKAANPGVTQQTAPAGPPAPPTFGAPAVGGATPPPPAWQPNAQVAQAAAAQATGY